MAFGGMLYQIQYQTAELIQTDAKTYPLFAMPIWTASISSVRGVKWFM